MAVDVIMPQLGESVVEGTVLKWLVREGERVAKDQPLLSVSTDKVDAEIPSPAAGTVASVQAKEGDVVPVKALLCRIDTEGVAALSTPAGAKGKTLGWDEEEEGFPGHMARGDAPPLPAPPPVVDAPPAASPGIPAAPPAGPPPRPVPPATTAPSPPQVIPAVTTRVRITPVVSRMAAELGLDLSRISGTGTDGRVTKRDVERFLDAPAATGGPSPILAASAPSVPVPATAPPAAVPSPLDFVFPRVAVEEGDEVVPFTAVRRRIAAHMTASKRISAHVHSVAEVDLSAVTRHRWAAQAKGRSLTFLPYVLRAAVLAFTDYPRMNALVDGGERVVVKRAVHMAVAVETERGLMVPVIRNAGSMDLAALAAAVEDLSLRAREKRILPDEMAGGTFSVSNPGAKGNLFGTPILNQPQVGILRMGQVVRRPVVVTEADGGEAIAVRPMMYLVLGYDHRVVDGVEGNGFLFRVREILESGSFDG